MNPLMTTKQQTLKAPISFSGKGLHTGVKVTMTVNPAEAGTGIVFRRTDIEVPSNISCRRSGRSAWTTP